MINPRLPFIRLFIVTPQDVDGRDIQRENALLARP
jgi:hypothetical protein